VCFQRRDTLSRATARCEERRWGGPSLLSSSSPISANAAQVPSCRSPPVVSLGDNLRTSLPPQPAPGALGALSAAERCLACFWPLPLLRFTFRHKLSASPSFLPARGGSAENLQHRHAQGLNHASNDGQLLKVLRRTLQLARTTGATTEVTPPKCSAGPARRVALRCHRPAHW
jgi:hypothetical protein